MTASTPADSPCTGVCRMDEATGLCIGCRRTVDEITAWPRLDEQERALVRARMASRPVPLGGAASPGGAGCSGNPGGAGCAGCAGAGGCGMAPGAGGPV